MIRSGATNVSVLCRSCFRLWSWVGRRVCVDAPLYVSADTWRGRQTCDHGVQIRRPYIQTLRVSRAFDGLTRQGLKNSFPSWKELYKVCSVPSCAVSDFVRRHVPTPTNWTIRSAPFSCQPPPTGHASVEPSSTIRQNQHSAIASSEIAHP